jgi:uncharacterized protein (DUF305 family)
MKYWIKQTKQCTKQNAEENRRYGKVGGVCEIRIRSFADFYFECELSTRTLAIELFQRIIKEMQKNAAIIIFLATAIAGCSGRSPNVSNVDPARTEPAGTPHVDHMNMPSSPGAADAPYDLQFLDTMIAHHKDAIDMARLAGSRAQHDELKQLARNIITDQQREIEKMQGWRSKWFGEAPQAVNMQFPGMAEGMSGMNMEKLDSLKANSFDLEFIRQMIPHHEGALAMAKDALVNGSNAEIKSLARQIVEAQEAEIRQMRQWQEGWK